MLQLKFANILTLYRLLRFNYGSWKILFLIHSKCIYRIQQIQIHKYRIYFKVKKLYQNSIRFIIKGEIFEEIILAIVNLFSKEKSSKMKYDKNKEF